MQIDTESYECMHDIPCPKGMCSESSDPFTFWEISDNITETVPDRDIVAMEDQQKIVCGLSNGTIVSVFE